VQTIDDVQEYRMKKAEGILSRIEEMPSIS